MKRTLVPVEVSLVTAPDGQQRMVSTIPLGHLLSDTPGMAEAEQRLSSFTKEYLTKLEKCREEIRQIEKEKKERDKVNPLHFWRIGDSLRPYFVQEPSHDSFVLYDPYAHFTRDLSLSKSTLQKIVTFRRRFNSPQSVDPSKTWDYYRESKYLKEQQPPPRIKVAQQEKQEAIAFIRLTVPSGTDISWLTMRLRRWLYGEDSATTPPGWLKEEGIEFDGYQVFYGNKLPATEKGPS